VTERTRERGSDVGGMSTLASQSATTLGGHRLRLARAVWVTVATLALGLFVASVPSYVFYVLELGHADWMGTPVEAPAELIFALNPLGVLLPLQGY
jgi:hypothetical protein